MFIFIRSSTKLSIEKGTPSRDGFYFSKKWFSNFGEGILRIFHIYFSHPPFGLKLADFSLRFCFITRFILIG